ncbi:nuclear transport factor 2 family protein [Zeaxanthinibacter sp. PT1]|uniref:nuclear transport factor 2 family protein n=1 Tax=Zeaxanthinibacter TaxID=561554 RepID=UPI002349A1A1|nr:nuclear transport factor 2 family protein [Zeaxanthinibacter sp. PT1]MDC6350350.1 nuclear transport factor 2 family protein [Zeaxanthinibacter sp. PT1]
MNRNVIILALIFACGQAFGQMNPEDAIGKILDRWHQAASDADFEGYFDLMTDDAVFIGTDATELWGNQAFKEFSKPYFDRGKAWNFTSLERNIYLGPDGKIAWFDELLDTQMKLCRGSGVLRQEDGQWKIAHYVLSIAVPNEVVDKLILLKKEKDSLLTEKLRKP